MKLLERLFRRKGAELVETPEDRLSNAEERKAWMDRNGFQLVLEPMGKRYVPGFDPDTEYQFMRESWEEPAVFRLGDQHGLFNVWGLRYRPLDGSPRPS